MGFAALHVLEPATSPAFAGSLAAPAPTFSEAEMADAEKSLFSPVSL